MDRCRELGAQLVEDGEGVRGRGRDPLPDARRGRRPAGTTSSAAASRCRTPSSRTSSSSAPTVGRRTTSPRPSRTWTTRSRHVIRGDDHISNTPKQIQILRALGHEPPAYAHLGSLLGDDGKKLSKRHGALGVDEFRAAGYIPEALVNFLALIGWAPDGETTVMSRDEIVERFRLEAVSPSPGTFDYAKLDWLNGVYLRALDPRDYADRLVALRGRAGARLAGGARARGGAARPGEDRSPRRVSRRSRASSSVTSSRTRPSSTRRSSTLRLDALEDARAVDGRGARGERSRSSASELGEKPRKVYAPIRVAVTGSTRLAGALRVARAARPRDDPRAAATGRRGRGVSARSVD